MSTGNTTAGVADAELKYLSFMVAFMPGLAFCCMFSRTENSLPRLYGILVLASFNDTVKTSSAGTSLFGFLR